MFSFTFCVKGGISVQSTWPRVDEKKYVNNPHYKCIDVPSIRGRLLKNQQNIYIYLFLVDS